MLRGLFNGLGLSLELIAYALLALLLGCATAPKPAATTPVSPSADGSSPGNDTNATSPPPTAAALRALPVHPTFADLVDAARQLDALGHVDQGCLLRGNEHFQLEADISSAVKPLPAAPAELSTQLAAAAGPVAVLSAWANLPGELPGLALVTFTTTTSAAASPSALSIFLTRKGNYLRGSAQLARLHPEALSTDALGTWLTQIPEADASAVYVTAEAAVPLTELRAVLTVIPSRFEVALAVALPKNTRLPAALAHTTELACPDGLPEPKDDDAEGDLSAEALMGALTPLRNAALSCALATGGRALLGGKLALALRIDASGHPSELCMQADEIDDVLLRRCIIENARGLKFPVPNPAGYVDALLPLNLQLAGPQAQRTLCDP